MSYIKKKKTTTNDPTKSETVLQKEKVHLAKIISSQNTFVSMKRLEEGAPSPSIQRKTLKLIVATPNLREAVPTKVTIESIFHPSLLPASIAI